MPDVEIKKSLFTFTPKYLQLSEQPSTSVRMTLLPTAGSKTISVMR